MLCNATTSMKKKKKERKGRISKRYLHSPVHCSTIHNSQEVDKHLSVWRHMNE